MFTCLAYILQTSFNIGASISILIVPESLTVFNSFYLLYIFKKACLDKIPSDKGIMDFSLGQFNCAMASV